MYLSRSGFNPRPFNLVWKLRWAQCESLVKATLVENLAFLRFVLDQFTFIITIMPHAASAISTKLTKLITCENHSWEKSPYTYRYYKYAGRYLCSSVCDDIGLQNVHSTDNLHKLCLVKCFKLTTSSTSSFVLAQ